MPVCRRRCAEQREDAVAGRLHDVAVVAMRRVDHQLECGVDERARLLRVEVAHQFVEPLMSANSAVTVLRSPSIASDAAPSAATMTCDLGEATVVETAAFVRPIAVPHFLQNRAPGLTDALHAGQISSSFVPHPSQNEASPGLSWLHDGQRIGSPGYYHTLRGRRKEDGSVGSSVRASSPSEPDPGASPSYGATPSRRRS